MFFGIEHAGGHGRGMERALAAAAKPGARCFLEIAAAGLKIVRAHGELFQPGTVGWEEGGTFIQLIRWLDARGVEVVPLDKQPTLDVMRKLRKSFDAWRQANISADFESGRVLAKDRQAAEDLYYVNILLREKQWLARVRREARATDFVVAHPDHIARLVANLCPPMERVHYVDRPGEVRMAWRIRQRNLSADERMRREILGLPTKVFTEDYLRPSSPNHSFERRLVKKRSRLKNLRNRRRKPCG